MPTDVESVRAVAERAARTGYGRLVALLAASMRDVARAEDVLADAFERALASGIPDNPKGWLLTVARNRLRDVLGSAARRTSAPLSHGIEVADALDVAALAENADAIGDKRLELLFVCAHPAIDARICTPLMLQTVLGFGAAQIARAFDVEPAAMAQRLVRAKHRIRDTGIPFVVPTRADLPTRPPTRRVGDPWPRLDDQNPAPWSTELIREGEALLRRAGSFGKPLGRFQLEAAIQSVHCDRARSVSRAAAAREARLVCGHHCLDAVAYPQLDQDARHVAFHGRLGDH